MRKHFEFRTLQLAELSGLILLVNYLIYLQFSGTTDFIIRRKYQKNVVTLTSLYFLFVPFYRQGILI